MEFFKREPAAIIGVVVAVITSIIAAAGDGGWQWDPDGWVVLSQLATALGIRQVVFSPHTAEKLKIVPLEPAEGTTLKSSSAERGSRGIR